MKNQEKVFVLDFDLISPLGIGKGEIFQNLEADRLGCKKISRFATEGLPLDFAAEIATDLRPFYQDEPVRLQTALQLDHKFELVAAAYHLMAGRLQELFSLVAPEQAGVILGVGADVLSVELLENQFHTLFERSDNPLADFVLSLNLEKGCLNTVLNPYDTYAIYLAEKLNLAAFQKTTLTACTASTQAIALASDAIRRGEAEMVLAGGTDSIINALAFMSFSKLGVLASGGTTPERACKPFDVNREGTLAGEAAGLCVLAGEKTVRRLGLEPKFELLGYGNTLDAYKITCPDPSGKGIVRALEMALRSSGIRPEEVNCINLHGTGTRNNDQVELDALARVFGPALENIPLSSTKDRHGHAIAAAGIQEFILLCLGMEQNFIPANLNLEKPIYTQGFDLVQKQNREKKINVGLTTNFAFGGVNTVLALKNLNAQ